MQDPTDPQTMPLQVAEQTPNTAPAAGRPIPWWDHEDFPFSAPWWLRYPVGFGCVFGAYYLAFDWAHRLHWLASGFLALVALAFLRELFFGLVLAAIAGLVLWALGAAVVALPVSVAIIIGAVIIANAVRR
jgi:hypothetical protein